jgi:hypothetical protein
VTTAAAFFNRMTDFLGVRELGLVAGGGVLCVLATVVCCRRWCCRRSSLARAAPQDRPAGRWCSFRSASPACHGRLAGTWLSAGTGRLRYDHNLPTCSPVAWSSDIGRQLLGGWTTASGMR